MAKIDIGEDALHISDSRGEIVCWVMDEWKEDPSIVPAMVNAIKLVLDSGGLTLRKLVNCPVNDTPKFDVEYIGDAVRLVWGKKTIVEWPESYWTNDPERALIVCGAVNALYTEGLEGLLQFLSLYDIRCEDCGKAHPSSRDCEKCAEDYLEQ